MAQIAIRNVSKIYDNSDKVVLHHVDLEIRDNEFLVLVGPSGCGKTTLLRMVAGLERITEGDILIGDRVVNDLQPKDRNISMVFQNYALYPHLNVYGNLAFGLKRQKRPKAEIDEKVRRIAEMLELGDLLKRKPGELSGGQRQRVALGRALARETEAILMDEPLSNLDAKLRVQTRGEIINLHRKLPRTVIYVTHDQTEAMTMGDRIVVMNGGVIQQVGTPEEVYHRPANVFVAGFIGSPPMNFFSCVLEDDGETMTGACGEIRFQLPVSRVTPRMRSAAGQTVIAGIRPEHLFVTKDLAQPHLWEASVKIVEVLGLEQRITFDMAGSECTARIDCTEKFFVGDAIAVQVESSAFHFFDGTTEENISLLS